MAKVEVYRTRKHLKGGWQKWKYCAYIEINRDPLNNIRFGGLPLYARLDSLAKRVALNLHLEGITDFEVLNPQYYFEPRIRQKKVTVVSPDHQDTYQLDHLPPNEMEKLKQKIEDYMSRQQGRSS